MRIYDVILRIVATETKEYPELSPQDIEDQIREGFDGLSNETEIQFIHIQELDN